MRVAPHKRAAKRRATTRGEELEPNERNVANPIVRMSAVSDMKAIAMFSERWRSELAAI
jgi:hypothetical protein